jgi:hypothetical protein
MQSSAEMNKQTTEQLLLGQFCLNHEETSNVESYRGTRMTINTTSSISVHMSIPHVYKLYAFNIYLQRSD